MSSPDVPAKQPRAFLSHASDDKERFVRRLDAELRAAGVDTFLDERDLHPGDRLIERIFDQGISVSDVVIVVLSKYTVDRPWVREELDAAVVQRITGNVKKIIPVVLDGVKPPDVLSATVWERINDIANVDAHIENIIAAIFGTQPPRIIGQPPAYTQQPIAGLGMNTTDEHVLRIAGDMLVKQDRDPTISVGMLWLQAQELGILESDFEAALFHLRREGYFVKFYGEGGTRWPIAFRISSHGFSEYLRGYRRDDYVRAVRDVVAAIVNQSASSAADLVRITGLAPMIVEWVIDELESRGYMRGIHSLGETRHFVVEGSLQRLLEGLS